MERNAATGVVYLVGAGPGAVDLITVRGLRILCSADVVLHDALVSPELLAEVRPDAEVVSVGKRGYCIGSTRQETINEALVRHAKAGRSVCRLKCGDPCVFGRGGEEAEALAEASLPFEIVPGVTSATGACAAAGIPLTHRAVGGAVALITGHHDPDSPDCMLDWDALARLPGLVFYMALRHADKIAIRLAASGLPPQTPAAVIESGTLPAQRVVVAELWDIGRAAAEAALAGPAILVVGEAVRLREKLYPFINSQKNKTTQITSFPPSAWERTAFDAPASDHLTPSETSLDATGRDAERRGMRSHAERGNEVDQVEGATA